MDNILFMQQVAKKTYAKIFVILNAPILLTFIWTYIRGEKPSFLYLVLSMLVITTVTLGGLELLFPKRPALKIESDNFFIFHKGKWLILNQNKEFVFGSNIIKFKIQNQYIVIHFEDKDFDRLKILLNSNNQ